MRPPRARLVSLVALLVAGGASAQDSAEAGAPLGEVLFPVSCTDGGQRAFDQGLLLLHHMTYPLAREAFGRAAEIDPDCAMAHWGVAMTLFQPLWPTRPGPADLQRGWAAVRRAEALALATEHERLFVAAAAAFFDGPEAGDYWDRIGRWGRASEALSLAFPDDPEATVFYALSLLATAPAVADAHERQDRAAALLLGVLGDYPLHPGASHYLLHANDTPGREHESPDVVRHYAAVAPDNPHALHMPTHIYTRLGEWEAVVEGNLRAADAALRYPAGDEGQYVWDEFPHAIEYLVYADLQRGDDDAAAVQIERLRATPHLEPSSKTAFHLASIPARYALERGAWDDAAALTPRPSDAIDWDRFPWPEAVTWFARGLGTARLGRLDGAVQALDRLEALEGVAEEAGETLFARQIRILRLGVAAWAAQARGEEALAVEQMTQAADLEASTPKPPVTPGPTLPASELLGTS
ncbi:hypothetical protein [Rubrivirga marina]|uniref:Tetratricopeptide repeat protein n=1 Tax=Rubrivirga marina TaxID=1196024 RepID=A0A271IZ26_9BACT|nr:hypothetical protein [Rubrivirga marina]PAP75955.1 hypothetical protein BSZ37_05625 [Rubrivirga marina]